MSGRGGSLAAEVPTEEPGAIERILGRLITVSQALRRATEAGLRITFMYLVSQSRIVVGADDLDALAAHFAAES